MVVSYNCYEDVLPFSISASDITNFSCLFFFFFNRQLQRSNKVMSTSNGLTLCVLTWEIDIHCVGWVTGDALSSKYIHTEEECGNPSRVYLTCYGDTRL